MLAHLKTSTIHFRQRREWKPAWTTIAIERSRKMSSDDICYNLLLAAKNINTLSLQWYSLCWSRPMWLCLWIPSSFVFTTRLEVTYLYISGKVTVPKQSEFNVNSYNIYRRIIMILWWRPWKVVGEESMAMIIITTQNAQEKSKTP